MMMVTAENVSAVMALSPPIRSFAALDAAVREGLPESALRESVAHIARSNEERRVLASRIVSKAALRRRRNRLTPVESEKTERLARTFAAATLVWCDEDDARDFLNTAHPLLEGCRPLEVAMTELGARRVEAVLGRLFYGMPV